MPRCDYDSIFYRVFCITLLGIAFTFTVILTNVFIDIDGILAKKDRGETDKTIKPTNTPKTLINNEVVYQGDLDMPTEKVFHEEVSTEPVFYEEEQTEPVFYREEMQTEVQKDTQKKAELYGVKPKREEDDLQTENFFHRDDLPIEKVFHGEDLQAKSVFHREDLQTESVFHEKVQTEVKTATETYRKHLQMELVTDKKGQKEMPKKAELYGVKPMGEEDEDAYRTKRSLDTRKFKYRTRTPTAKELLNSQLASLLNELDAEEARVIQEQKEMPVETTKATATTSENPKEKSLKPEDDILHLAMHNILLQGIIGHMSLNQVYKKIHELMDNFDNNRKDKESINEYVLNKPPQKEEPRTPFSVENSFFEELVNCKELKKQLGTVTKAKLEDLKMEENKGPGLALEKNNKKDSTAPEIIIKTVIDIKTLDNRNNITVNHNPSNIKGLIKLIYNGILVKLSPMDEAKSTIDDKTKCTTVKDQETKEPTTEKLDYNVEEVAGTIVDNFLDKALVKYFKKHPKLESKFSNKRLKRHTKSRARKSTEKEHKSTNDEELYVEIETHLDGSGINNDKKKELIKTLVEKIQKAVDANLKKHKNHKKKNKFVHVRKRQQNPLKIKEDPAVNKFIIPLDNILIRNSEPIGNSLINSLRLENPPIYPRKHFEETLNRGPGFLSSAKSINSGEMGTVDLDLDHVIKETGIPQRLQKPLNTDSIHQQADIDYNTHSGDMKLYMKEIEGSGISVGYNQYVGEAPDPDSIKLYTGIQELITDYHKNYQNANVVQSDYAENTDINHELRKRDVQDVLMDTNNINNDYHFNKYKVVFDQNSLPYDSYSEILNNEDEKISLDLLKDKSSALNNQTNSLSLLLDGNSIMQNLNPSQIFSLANLLDRRKRSSKVIKYSDVNKRTKVNRYIKLSTFNKNKRYKREVGKIRIIASDLPFGMRRSSGDKLYYVNEENIFADRAVVGETDKERDTDSFEPETEQEDDNFSTLPANMNENQRYNPYILHAHSMHNALMSKYPHVFLEEQFHQSDEENNAMVYKKLFNDLNEVKSDDGNFYMTGNVNNEFSLPNPPKVIPNIDPMIMNMNAEATSKPNYKLTVKIIPKNISDLHPGFKEMHTTINKTFNKNGVIYSSQLNVTEITKIENETLKKDPVITEYQVSKTPLNDNSVYNVNQVPKTQLTANHNSFDNVKVNKTISNISQESSPLYVPIVQHIKEQQQKMTELLKEHQRRIDQQLKTLRQEKLNIESVIPFKNIIETIDVMLPLNPPQILHLNKDEAGQLISNALMKLHNAPELNDILNVQNTTMKQHFSTVISTTAQPRTESTYYTTEDAEKQRILKHIQRNENLTHAILFKIDRNSHLLQNFLQILSQKLESPSILPQTHSDRTQKGPNHDSTYNQKPVFEPYIQHAIPKLETHKNTSESAIPFVYAYQQVQQPFPPDYGEDKKKGSDYLNNKPNNQLTNVVFQGHIHTNGFNNNNLDSNKKIVKEKRDINGSVRFFMDEIDNNMSKIMPADSSGKQSYPISRFKNNNTRI